MRRQLQKDPFSFELHDGIEAGVKLCCIIWYESVWNTLRADHDFNSSWYNEDFSGYDTSKLTYENGIILCPDCVIERLTTD